MTEMVAATPSQARALTDRIKVAVEGTWLLIQEAYTTRAWAALGYGNWDAYCAKEFGTARLRLPREERQEVVASLRDSGLSIRAISSATGVARNTVRDDLHQVGQSDPPGGVTGADGKTYTAIRPATQTTADLLAGDDWIEAEPEDLVTLAGMETVTPSVTVRTEPEPAKPKRRPLPEAFADAAHDYVRAAEKLTRLTEDDRFARNRDTTHHQLSDLVRALEDTAALIAAMHPDQADTSQEARRWWATSLHKTSDALRDVANTLE